MVAADTNKTKHTDPRNEIEITEAMIYVLHRYQQAQPPSILPSNT